VVVVPTFHHANLGVLPDGIAAESEFLVDILGYRLIEVDEEIRRLGAHWFEADDGSQIHLSADPDHRAARRAHTAIEYGSGLDGVLARISEAGVDFSESLRPGFPRVVTCRDPAGNLWELRGELSADEATAYVTNRRVGT